MKYQILFLLFVVMAACGDDDGTTDASTTDASTAADAATDARQSTDARPTPDSGPAMCEMSGATRTAVCGMCGMRSESCEGGFWSPQSECLGQGECSAGDVETEDTPMCGRRQRLCFDGCIWGDWEALVEDGECVAGETEMRACADGVLVEQTCSDDCRMNTEEACMTECGIREALPIDDPLMERVCVPTGETTIFYIGSDGERHSRNPTVSAFWIMRYPVVGRLYATCVDAGDCLEPYETLAPYITNEPDHAVLASEVGDGNSFCARVGGQLTSLAEHTRAARGECALYAPYAWSECNEASARDEESCATLTLCDEKCPERSVCTSPVNGSPEVSSPFGVERLTAPGYPVWLSDGFQPDLGPEYDGLNPRPEGDLATVSVNELGAGRLGRSSDAAVIRCVWRSEK